jgi:toxin-antitoxin system PIN domain toxin
MRRYSSAAASPGLAVRESPRLPWVARTGDLLDINVWLALAVEEHPHHPMALRYWAEVQAGGATLWFCRVTMLGLVRLLCQPKVVGKGALDLSAAWALYQRFRAIASVRLADEPDDCEDHLARLITAAPLPPRLWTDAWLAALSQASGLRLVTFDADFRRFGLERCLVLPRD